MRPRQPIAPSIRRIEQQLRREAATARVAAPPGLQERVVSRLAPPRLGARAPRDSHPVTVTRLAASVALLLVGAAAATALRPSRPPVVVGAHADPPDAHGRDAATRRVRADVIPPRTAAAPGETGPDGDHPLAWLASPLVDEATRFTRDARMAVVRVETHLPRLPRPTPVRTRSAPGTGGS